MSKSALSRLLVALPLAACLVPTAIARAGDPAPASPPSASKEGVRFEKGTPPFADVLTMAKELNKPVFIDFTTDWCGWCRRLEKDTYSKPAVGEAMNAFVNVMVDAEKGEGPALANRYNAHGYPTLVVVDATGDEIDRIVGYRPPEKFLPEIARILRGENTLQALKKRLAADPKDFDAILTLAEKQLEADPAAAEKTIRAVPEDVKPKDDEQAARRGVILAEAMAEGRRSDAALDECERVMTLYPGTQGAVKAARIGGGIALQAGPERAQAYFANARAAAKTDAERSAIDGMTFHVHLQLAAKALVSRAAGATDAEELNEIAWTAHEFKFHPAFRSLNGAAVGWARKAVELSKGAAPILDTLASLLADGGKFAEAIEIEEKALTAVEDGAMKDEFAKNVAEWKAKSAAMKARGAVPATPVEEPEEKPAPDKPSAPAPTPPSKPQPGGAACGGGSCGGGK